MKIRILGAGWFGSHLGAVLIEAGHDVEIHEIADRLFACASGNNPARLHIGCHYPRSKATRIACQTHNVAFMARYGALTRGIAKNIYAIAAHDSWLDFGTYRQIMEAEIDLINIDRPEEFGLQNIEGAIQVNERHIIIDRARALFADLLGSNIHYNTAVGDIDDPRWDLTIDATFCALDGANIDRYEPCAVALVEGPTDSAVTIMDGPFGSLYPWNEQLGLSSLTSAKFTPFERCPTRSAAETILANVTVSEARLRADLMMAQMAHYWPAVLDLYKIADVRLSIRAMPRSGADSRLVDMVRVGSRVWRIRAGKITSIFEAERRVKMLIESIHPANWKRREDLQLAACS